MSRTTPDLETYFGGLIPPRDQVLLDLERESRDEGIPIIGPVVGELLFILARVTGARQILELGTATGYSAIYLARGCQPAGGRVVSLELEEGMADRARRNWVRAGVAGQAEVRVGEALQLMETMPGPVDFIFMDIDKESYLPALAHCGRLLRPGGLLVTDNVSFAGAAAFNREIFASPDWRVVHLLGFLPLHSPEHDGISLAVRI